MSHRSTIAGAGVILLLLSIPAAGQVPPFFGGTSVAFDPEVAVISSGALLDAQATVSADRKHVTLNMQPQLNRLRSLQPFPVNAVVNQGFVGGINLPSGTAVASNAPADTGPDGQAVSNTTPSPDALARTAKARVFTREGMYLVARLP